MLVAIVDYSSTGATYLGLWAHLQQPLATTTGIYSSYTTVSKLRTVRSTRRTKNLLNQQGNDNNEKKELKATTF